MVHPTPEAVETWQQRLSLLDWARVCRIRSLHPAAPYLIGDADGLMMTYGWRLHDLRHRLDRPDPTDWFLALVDLERTQNICFISVPTDGGTWDLGEYWVTTAGAIQLLQRFGVGRPWWEDRWTCEDCVCRHCHAPVPYPFQQCFVHSECLARIREHRRRAHVV
jgi:hypothetical protein